MSRMRGLGEQCSCSADSKTIKNCMGHVSVGYKQITKIIHDISGIENKQRKDLKHILVRHQINELKELLSII